MSIMRIAINAAVGAVGLGLLLAGSHGAAAQERPAWGGSEPRPAPYEDRREPRDAYDDRSSLPPPAYEPPPPQTQPVPYGSRDAYGSREPYGRSRDDAYRPPGGSVARSDAYQPPARTPQPYGSGSYGSSEPLPPPGYGAPYDQPPPAAYEDRRDAYNAPPPPRGDYDRPRDGTFSLREIRDAGHGFFGSISQGLASVIEHAFKQQGRPNGYILGEDLGGAFVAGLRYGEGTLFTKDAGNHKVYWQGPSIGYDAGAEGSKVMVLVYNLRDPSDIYERFGGIAGSAYVVGGVGLTFQSHGDVVLAPIRSGIGLRLGANIGYLKYTRRPTWNPF